MTEWAPPFTGEPGPTLRTVVSGLLEGWRQVLACALLAFLAALAGLRMVPPEYTAAMVVGPTARTGVAAMGPRVPLLRHDGASGLAEPGAGDETLSDYARFLELLGSVPVARRLMADPGLVQRLFPGRWDGAEGRWRPPCGVLAPFKAALLWLAGREDWVEPDAEAVARALRERLTIVTVGSGPMRRIQFRDADRAFALELLDRLAAAADAQLRAEAARRSRAEIAYVRARRDAVSMAEHRKALTDLLSDQERVLIMIEVDLPLAADPIVPPFAAQQPDWPNPQAVIAAALALGLVAGVVLAAARARR